MIQPAKNDEDCGFFLRKSSFVRGILLVIYFPNYLYPQTLICRSLRYQALALEIFRNYAKYNITLTPNAGRWLIHSVHVHYPPKDLLIAASLFSVHNISISEDLIPASMVTAACLKHDTPESKAMADFLLPKIKTLVKKKKPSTPASYVEMKGLVKWLEWLSMSF